jgi:hypothetical protein
MRRQKSCGRRPETDSGNFIIAYCKTRRMSPQPLEKKTWALDATEWTAVSAIGNLFLCQNPTPRIGACECRIDTKGNVDDQIRSNRGFLFVEVSCEPRGWPLLSCSRREYRHTYLHAAGTGQMGHLRIAHVHLSVSSRPFDI